MSQGEIADKLRAAAKLINDGAQPSMSINYGMMMVSAGLLLLAEALEEIADVQQTHTSG